MLENRTDLSKNEVFDLMLKDSLGRLEILSYVLAAIFSVYGFNSLEFIARFHPGLTLWGNVWPRLLVGTLPFLVLAGYLRKSSQQQGTKLMTWLVSFSVIFHASSWIYVWPIALTGAGSILTYVQPANVFLVAIVFATAAPPMRYLIAFSASLVAFIYVPLLTIAYLSGDAVVFRLIFNDSLIALGCSIAVSKIIDRLRMKVAELEFEKQRAASKFLGPVVSKAIFSDEKKHLEKVRCKGFVVSIDIRDSTHLLQKHKERWLEYRADYFKLVSRLASAHSGYIQKTAGDSHIVNFGIMDYGVDLSDIPGIETDLSRAEEKRLQRASDSAFAFMSALFQMNHELSSRFFPGAPVALGAGMDQGWVERGLQGDAEHNLELDVNGEPVNCSSRLQEYAKSLKERLSLDGSIFVVSPYACDYLRNTDHFSRMVTEGYPIRNYAQIRWVLIRTYAAPHEAAGGHSEGSQNLSEDEAA
jgi:class 3 adenylate cyclase